MKLSLHSKNISLGKPKSFSSSLNEKKKSHKQNTTGTTLKADRALHLLISVSGLSDGVTLFQIAVMETLSSCDGNIQSGADADEKHIQKLSTSLVRLFICTISLTETLKIVHREVWGSVTKTLSSATTSIKHCLLHRSEPISAPYLYL